jgi:hypothetical protein
VYLPLSEQEPNERFEPIKATVRRSINNLPEDVRPAKRKRDAMAAKINELNREALVPSAMRFFKRIFTGYPHQSVQASEIRTFVSIRNSITHSGVMDLDDLKLPIGFPYDYDSVLPAERQRLESLLERVVLAQLEERHRLMDVPWQNWRDA